MMIISGVFTFELIVLFHCIHPLWTKDLPLVIFHNNDMHARFEQTSRNSGACKNLLSEPCFGGFARIAHVVRRYRQLAKEQKGDEVLFLNAGDTYTGTPWFSVHKWKICADFINLIQPDALSLGNHEFDNGVDGLKDFLTTVEAPILAANIRTDLEPTLTNIEKSVILTVRNVSIGIIGYLTKDTVLLSSPGRVQFDDEIEAIRIESKRLEAKNVKIIIALGHSGYQMDQQIAAQVPLVDLVVGGHTNTFLWNGKPKDVEVPEDVYPKMIEQSNGKRVPVVQAYAYTKYLGKLNVVFDDEGNLKHFNGQPILLDSSIPQEDDVLDRLEDYRPEVDELNNKIIGSTAVDLDGRASICRKAECNFGNLITDSYIYYVASMQLADPSHWTDYPIAIVNGGNIRNSIGMGNVSRGELLGVQPFGNQIFGISLNGTDLVKTLELGVRNNGETSSGEFLQVSGLHVTYDMKRPNGSRVISTLVRCGQCTVPMYEELEMNRTYNLITNSFLLNGGDGHYVLKEKCFNRKLQNLTDAEILEWYIGHQSPIYPEVQGRITFVTDDGNGGPVPKAIPIYLLFIFPTITLFASMN